MAKKTRRKRKRSGSKATTAQRGTAPRGSRGIALHSVSLGDLHQEIMRRQDLLEALEARRAEVIDELAGIDQELSHLGAAAAGRGRPRVARSTRRQGALGRPAATKARRGRPGGRKGNKATLVESLHQVLQNTTMGVTEVSEAVKKAGYKTNSPNFRTIVNQALLANTDRFKKVSRGQYTAK